MAIDKRLLDDIAPSSSAVSRLKNRPRRIKPWESDILLRSPDEQTPSGTVTPPTSGGTTSAPSRSTNIVPPTEAVLPTNGVSAPNPVLGTIPVVRPSSSPSSTSKLASPLVPNTKSEISTASVLGTEAVQTRPLASYCDPGVNENTWDRMQPRATESALSTDSVLGTDSGPATTLVAGPGEVPATESAVSTKSDYHASAENLPVDQRRIRHSTESGPGTNADVRYHSVPSTNAELSYQTGTIPKSPRSISTSPVSTKRVQPYVISETENFTRVPHAVTEALQRADFSSLTFLKKADA